MFNLKSSDPFLHIRAKYCSPTHSQASSSKGSPTRSRATPSRDTTSGDATSGNSSSEGTPPPPPQEPQVPSSTPAASSSLATGNSVPIADSSTPTGEHSKDVLLSLAEAKTESAGNNNATKDSLALNLFSDQSSLFSSSNDSYEFNSFIMFEPTNESSAFSQMNSSPTLTHRPMVNSTTFCIESNETVESQPSIVKTSLSQMSSSSSSSSSESSCSLRETPPPSPSTMSTPACASSTPRDLSLTPNGSSTTVGTPLPPDLTDQDEI